MGQPIPKIAHEFAEAAHAGQWYEPDLAYIYHPRQVVAVLERFGVNDPVCICAGYCHDTMEDRGVSYNDLDKKLGQEVAETVYAITDERGITREERHRKTYPKIKGRSRPLTVKLADRIANVEHSAARGGKADKYRAEYAGFKAALYDAPDTTKESGQIIARMWAHLDQLMK